MCGIVKINKVNYIPGNILKISHKQGVSQMKWGIQRGTHLAYNARIETVLNSEYWNDILANRCTLEVEAFYEKDGLFRPKAEYRTIHLPGLYQNTNASFVIFTQSSGSLVKKFHHRQPIIMLEKDKEEYLKYGKLMYPLKFNRDLLKIAS